MLSIFLALGLLFLKNQAHAQCDQYEAVEAAEKTDPGDVGDREECYKRDDAEGDGKYAQNQAANRARFLRSLLGQLFSSNRPFQGPNHRIKDDPSIRMIVWRQGWERGAFRVRHEPHHVSFSVADSGDVVQGPVGV